MRVLQMDHRASRGTGRGEEHVFGITPRYEDLKWTGLELRARSLQQITAIKCADWRKEIASHAELFAKLQPRLPPELEQTRTALAARLAA